MAAIDNSNTHSLSVPPEPKLHPDAVARVSGCINSVSPALSSYQLGFPSTVCEQPELKPIFEERDDTLSTFLTWKSDASVQADEEIMLDMIQTKVGNVQADAKLKKEIVEASVQATENLVLDMIETKLDSVKADESFKKDIEDAKMDLIEMMTVKLESLTTCMQRIEVDLKPLHSLVQRMQTDALSFQVSDPAMDLFSRRASEHTDKTLSKLSTLERLQYSTSETPERLESKGSFLERLEAYNQQHLKSSENVAEPVDVVTKSGSVESRADKNNISIGRSAKQGRAYIATDHEEVQHISTIKSGNSGKCVAYASYPFNTIQVEEGIASMTRSLPRGEKSGMQKLSAECLRSATAAELVRAMMVKHEMHEMGRRKDGIGLVRMILQRLFVIALWWDRMREYRRASCLVKILDSHYFEAVSMAAVVTNSMFVAFAADWAMKNPGKDPPEFLSSVEYGYIGFYICELLLKLVTYRLTFFFNRDMKWNWLDFILVVASSVELFIVELLIDDDNNNAHNVVFMRILRILKLAKILRAFRAMRFVRELVTIMESLKQSIYALFWVFIMLVLMLCIFALVILQGMAEYMTNEGDRISLDKEQLIREHFGSLAKSMLTLYMSVTGGGDWGVYYKMVESTGVFYSTMFLFFTFFFTFALFNMLTGIFVEKAVEVARPDRAELALQERRRARRDATEFKHLCAILDHDDQGVITWSDFQKYMHDETMVAYMASIGLEIHDVEMFFSMVAGTDQAVDIDRFVDACMILKGAATSIDVQQQIFEMHALARHMFRFENQCLQNLHRVEKEVARVVQTAV